MEGVFAILSIIAASTCSFLIAYFITPCFIKLAYSRNILDLPNTNLKNHKQPTPYLGGLVVFLPFILALAFFLPAYFNMSLFLIGTCVLLFVGLIDDLEPLTPGAKFIGQSIAALCFLKGGFYLKELFISAIAPTFLTWLAVLTISFFWILSVVNGFNLIDIMDGLAATVAIGASINFIACALLLGNAEVVILLACFIGALGGFLLFNRPPARMYLGDSGSLCIGGILATVPFLISWGRYNTLGYLAPLIILGVPLLEIMSLIIIRSWFKIPFYQGSPHHFAHFLLRQSWPKVQILWFAFIASLCLGCVAALFVLQKISLNGTLLMLFFGFILWCALLEGTILLTFSKK